jgi:AraC family transcriptional regulator
MNSQDIFSGCRADTITSRRAAVERAIAAMAETLDSPMSLKALAKKSWVSASHLDHVFRQFTGSSPRQFMGALRLQKAKQLLLTTRSKVIDTCLEVGFNSVGTFSYRFAELVGVPPAQLRKLVGCGILEHINGLKGFVTTSPGDAQQAVSGELAGPASFSGTTFIGLFSTPIPQAHPAACVVMSQPGRFTIPNVPDGEYYGFGVAFPPSDNPLTYFDNDAAWRASSHPKVIHIAQGKCVTDLRFELRPPDLTDPPILVAIPALLDGCFASPGAPDPGNLAN